VNNEFLIKFWAENFLSLLRFGFETIHQGALESAILLFQLIERVDRGGLI